MNKSLLYIRKENGDHCVMYCGKLMSVRWPANLPFGFLGVCIVNTCPLRKIVYQRVRWVPVPMTVGLRQGAYVLGRVGETQQAKHPPSILVYLTVEE